MGGSEHNTKIHRVGWEKVIATKNKGGINVGSFKAQNMSLRIKWWWRLKNEVGSLWTEVINCIHNLQKIM